MPRPLALAVVPFLVLSCGSPPPAAPTTQAPPPSAPLAAPPRERAIETSAVPEPPNLVAVARLSKPEALLGTVGNWTRLPIPNGRELVRSIADDTVADVVDSSEPIDAALAVGISRRGVDALIAFAVPVASYEQAKARLGEGHKLVSGPNGELKVLGIGKPPRSPEPAGRGGRRGQEEPEEDDEEDEGCTLAPSPNGAGRLVCGESQARVALAPYLSRTMPRESWPSDVHIELRPEPVRAPLMELRGRLPGIARALTGGTTPAIDKLVNASIEEAVDFVGDAKKLTLDAQIGDDGLFANTRFELQSSKSTIAKLLTSADRAEPVPAGFWHLPADTDVALFGRGSDPKHLAHGRQLLADVFLELSELGGVPASERQPLRDLVVDKWMPMLVSGPGVYGKGFDQAAVEKARKARAAVKEGDRAAEDAAETALLEQVLGYHLYQVGEPIAKVGPMVKDWSVLYNKPAIAKWIKDKSGTKSPLPSVRIAGTPAGVTLPKDTVHLEVSVPRHDLEATPSASVQGRPAPAPKKIKRRPVVLHLFAVPDGASTWLAVGLDGKLVAQKAAASLANAPDANTLGKDPLFGGLREGKLNAGGFVSPRGVAVVTAMDHGVRPRRDVFATVLGLPSKGRTPIFFTAKAESSSGGAGASTGSLRVSRAAIDDIVQVIRSMM